MVTFSVNYLAVIVAAIASMVIGFLWYGPLFGKIWMNLSGFTKKDMERAQKKGMTKSYVIMFISSLITALVLSGIISIVGMDMLLAVTTAFWVWLGFIASIMISTVLWEGKSYKLYLLNIGYWLINLIVMAVIISLWP